MAVSGATYPYLYRAWRHAHWRAWTRCRPVKQQTSSLGSYSRAHHKNYYCSRRHRGGGSVIPVRWQSGGGGGASGGNTGGPQGGGRGFFQNFIDNLRKGLERNREMQEGLKGFQEEREKMKQSYFMQAAKENMTNAKELLITYSIKAFELAKQGWSRTKEVSSVWYKQASETEIAKKGQDIGSQISKSAQETAEKVSEHAEELGKTDVAKTITKGATVVKEELLDDIIKESGPYQPPDKIRMRSEMASGMSTTTQESPSHVIEPNEDAREVVVTKQSRYDKWRQQWQNLRENNPISNTFYNLKMKYDESDNVVIRASRVLTDRVGETFGGVMTQSDMAEALAEIRKLDPSFSKEEFAQQCQFEIIPTILEAFLRGDMAVLKDWCHEAAFSVLSAVIEQRKEPGVRIDCKVLEVRDVDVVMAKLLDQGPVLVLTFQAQQLTIKSRGADAEKDEELLENIYYVWALCRDQTIYDPKAAWRVLEFGIQSAGKLLV